MGKQERKAGPLNLLVVVTCSSLGKGFRYFMVLLLAVNNSVSSLSAFSLEKDP